jgi:hypothetical protein
LLDEQTFDRRQRERRRLTGARLREQHVGQHGWGMA